MKLMLANLLPRLLPDNNEGVEVTEVIIATNPTTEGEATANYIARTPKTSRRENHENCDGNAGRLGS